MIAAVSSCTEILSPLISVTIPINVCVPVNPLKVLIVGSHVITTLWLSVTANVYVLPVTSLATPSTLNSSKK